MEWLQKVFWFSDLEKELLETDCEPSLFARYRQVVTACGEEVHIVNAPSSNDNKILLEYRIVLVHGVGGNASCFAHLGDSLNKFCSIVVIDLPGSGKSPMPKDRTVFNPYRTVELISEVIEKTCGESPFVVVGHSYGAAHALRVASGRLQGQCRGAVCITPPFEMDLHPALSKTLQHIPPALFDVLFRSRDRVGGLYSASVNRMVAKSAPDSARRQQLAVNLRSNTIAVLETLSRMRCFDPQVDVCPKCPVLVFGASEDQVCPVSKAKRLWEYLTQHTASEFYEVRGAGHAVLFEKAGVLSGIIASFLAAKVDKRLSMAWQLQYLASLDDKWSLKNEAKWKKLEPVGCFVGTSFFKGMKVLREGDPVHGPAAFEEVHPEVKIIIDISREVPPYDPLVFKNTEYIKFPTVSKVPPSVPEVSAWIDLVNDLKSSLKEGEAIGVHCHYGFNRTGFFICNYLIQQLNYTVADALAAYATSRPPGVRHQHFIDELHVRYE